MNPDTLSSMEFDAEELERELCRIPEVFAARIVVNSSGSPTEARILASPDRPPKRVRRDVQSVALASFGVELAPGTISITQIEEGGRPEHVVYPPPAASPEPPAEQRPEEPRTAEEPREPVQTAAPPAAPATDTDRVEEPEDHPVPPSVEPEPAATTEEPEPEVQAPPPEGEEVTPPARAETASVEDLEQGRPYLYGGPDLRSVTTTTTGRRCIVEVVLESGGYEVRGRSDANVARSIAKQLAARATLAAVAAADAQATGLELEGVVVEDLGQHSVATVLLALPAHLAVGEDVISGSAVVGDAGEHEAVVLAVLDASHRALNP